MRTSDLFIPGEHLQSYERWELDSLAEPAPANEQAPAPFAPEPEVDAQPAVDLAAEYARIEAEAHAAGFAAGYRDGAARAAQETTRLAAIAQEAQNALGRTAAQVSHELLDLALEVARQIVRTELKVRRESLIAVVREAIDCLPHGAASPQLMLHPDDVELVRAHIGDELKAGSFRVVEDQRVDPGGCRIVSASCEVDATLPTRWKRVVATLGVDHDWLERD